MPAYEYDKLEPDRKEIRICTVHPGAFDDPIRCSLRTVSLQDDPEYETLSYAWGEPVFDHELLVDGAVLNVTRNLFNAVRYLRRQYLGTVDDSSWDPEASGILWADAIFINQGDVDERSSQVSLMGEIYSHGIKLHVWIGTAEDIREDIRQQQEEHEDDRNLEHRAKLNTSLLSKGLAPSMYPKPLASASNKAVDADVLGAIEILQLFARDQHLHEMPFFRNPAKPGEVEFDNHWYKSILMLSGILTQPWWKRVWVVQEVLLSTSTEATLLHINQYSTPLASCDNLQQYLLKHHCCREWSPVIARSWVVFTRLYNGSASLQGLLEPSASYHEGSFDLKSVYDICCLRQTGNPHDYVYGFRSLMKSSSLNLEVDYQMPVAQLYLAATGELLKTTNSLEYLGEAVGFSLKNRHKLPSWCIDWCGDVHDMSSDRDRRLFNAAREHSHYEESTAAGERPFEIVHRGIDIDALQIEAAVESRVIRVTGLTKEMGVDLVDGVTKWMRAIGYCRDHMDDLDVVLRVLTRDFHLDEHLEYRRVSLSYLDTLRQWSHLVSSTKRRPDTKNLLSSVDSDMRRQQRLFATSSSRLAAGPTTMKEDDVVFLAKGSRMPLLLREYHNIATGSGQQQDHHQHPSYQLVGRCYVHGIMDGEAVNADTDWQTIRLC